METVVAWGHTFIWEETTQSWVSRSGTQVVVVSPPRGESTRWCLLLPDQNNKVLEFEGEEVMERIFCAAEAFTRQRMN